MLSPKWTRRSRTGRLQRMEMVGSSSRYQLRPVLRQRQVICCNTAAGAPSNGGRTLRQKSNHRPFVGSVAKAKLSSRGSKRGRQGPARTVSKENKVWTKEGFLGILELKSNPDPKSCRQPYRNGSMTASVDIHRIQEPDSNITLSLIHI